jgi:hypothetical protein
VELKTVVNIFIALVWIGFGLFCKVLGLVPRQQDIVARILGERHSWLLTKLIGFSEVVMATWILVGYQSRFNALVQISIVAVMNIIEFVLARDLLLFGKLNGLFAGIFIIVVFLNAFVF